MKKDNKKNKKEKKSAGVFRNNAYMMKLAWRLSPGSVVVRFTDTVLDVLIYKYQYFRQHNFVEKILATAVIAFGGNIEFYI